MKRALLLIVAVAFLFSLSSCEPTDGWLFQNHSSYVVMVDAYWRDLSSVREHEEFTLKPGEEKFLQKLYGKLRSFGFDYSPMDLVSVTEHSFQDASEGTFVFEDRD
jgi:hypothetical protein